MKIAALCSGGKDGSYALWSALKEGHEVSNIVSIMPEKENSWMFHRPNPKIMRLFSKSSQIPLKFQETSGVKEKELKDLKSVLEDISIEGVVSGAVASTYQRNRIEKICRELDMTSLTPLWHKKPLKLLGNLSKENFEIIITSVSAEGLGKEWLGMKIDKDCIEDMKKMNEKYGVHLTGEGGEYETLTLDAPFFQKKIKILDSEKEWKGDRGHLKIKEAKLKDE